MNTHLRNEFIAILIGGLLLVVLIAAGVQGLPGPLAILRLVLGLIYVLFIPGHTLQSALFPRTIDLDNTERIALSFALSGAIVPPIALFLDRLPWGIRLWPVVISLSLFILVCMVAATVRRLRLPAGERFEPKARLDLRKWWAAQERAYRVVYVILAITLTTAFLTAFSILILPKPAEYFTEFYMLGNDGLAQDYPREAAVGQLITVTVGITNKEGSETTYQIRVETGGQILAQTGPVVMEDGKTWEQSLEFAMPEAGNDQQVEFILERHGKPAPYRALRLWINVKPPQLESFFSTFP